MDKKILIIGIGHEGNPARELMKLLADPVMEKPTLEAFDIHKPNRAERRRKQRRK
ncbi:MAG: hypothetical protein Q8O55_07340 [Dehalococcoidales bacterium]|nr:hypothetical protein [Dehalococcoidales bacterium]